MIIPDIKDFEKFLESIDNNNERDMLLYGCILNIIEINKNLEKLNKRLTPSIKRKAQA